MLKLFVHTANNCLATEKKLQLPSLLPHSCDGYDVIKARRSLRVRWRLQAQ